MVFSYVAHGYSALVQLNSPSLSLSLSLSLVNPRRMRSEGYGSQFVCLSVCLSVCLLPTNFVCKAKVRYHRVLHDVLQTCNVWISIKTLCSKVMALFAYHHCLPRSLKSSRWTEEAAVSSFKTKSVHVERQLL